jgi:LysR family transcriptional regulator, cell division regulator
MNNIDDISPRDLRYILVVLETLNMTRAASALGCSQTTLSYAVARIEKSLGATLFQRQSTGLVLNLGAEKFQKQAQIVLNEIEALKNVVRSPKKIEGLYHLGCHLSVGLSVLGQAISNLFREHELLRFKILTQDSRSTQSMLQDGKLDFGIIVNPSRSDELILRPVATDCFTFWKDKSLGNRKVPASKRILYLDQSSYQSQKLLLDLQKVGFELGRIIDAHDLELVGAMASRGGYALLPKRVADRFINLRKVDIKLGNVTFSDKFYLAYRYARNQSFAFGHIAKTLERELKSEFSKI